MDSSGHRLHYFAMADVTDEQREREKELQRMARYVETAKRIENATAGKIEIDRRVLRNLGSIQEIEITLFDPNYGVGFSCL